MDSTPNSAIIDFWNWFSTNLVALQGKDLSPDLIRDLEKVLHDIGPLDWELGPGKHKQYCFALSPRGDHGLLELTRKVVSFAPFLPDWEITASKPFRIWNLEFEVQDGDIVGHVDGKRWEFVAYRFKDGSYDLLTCPDSDCAFSQKTKELAALTIVDGEIGEEARMELIGCLEVVDKWDTKTEHLARKFEPGLLRKLLSV